VLWGLASEDLNVNLVAWPAGEGVATHVNAERDVLIVVVSGHLTIHVDGVPHTLSSDHAMLIPRGTTRSLTAAADGARYLSIHRRRPPLSLS
jgi:quercetin dioxygenase-like cupin family protein